MTREVVSLIRSDWPAFLACVVELCHPRRRPA